jgi:four helix bundle protein
MEKIDDYKKLVAWQLTMELGDLVDDMTSQPPASEDPDFCKQILKASAKAAPQVAEGFLRYRPKESAYYYRIARASLGEAQSHLLRGRHRKYWSEEVFKKAWDVSEGALKTTTGLLASRLRAIEEEEQRKRRQPKSEARVPQL